MRASLIFAAFLLCASTAAAQTARAPANVARPAAGPPTVITDRASFPRQLDRGDVIVELRTPAAETRRFGDANAKEQALERMALGDGREVYCGEAMPSAAFAAQLPAGVRLPPMCFRDSDNDSAADQVFSILGGDLKFGAALDAGSAIPPRAWLADTTIERRTEYRYGGAQSGRVLENGRLGEGAVEVIVVTATIDETQGLGQSQTSERMLIGCLGDGRCSPLPASIDPIIALANPTVEGAVEARIVSLPEAIAVSGEVSAMAARERARQVARREAQVSPAP